METKRGKWRENIRSEGDGKGRTGFAQWQWGEEEENETLIEFYRLSVCASALKYKKR